MNKRKHLSKFDQVMFYYQCGSGSSIDFQTCNVHSFESSDSDYISSNHQDVEATPQNAKSEVYV